MFHLLNILAICRVLLEANMDQTARVRAAFEAKGTSIACWARTNGFPLGLVYRVLRGEARCLRGKSHAIAVALHLKPPVSREQQHLWEILTVGEKKGESVVARDRSTPEREFAELD